MPIVSINHSRTFDRTLRKACRGEKKREKRERRRPSGFESLLYTGQEKRGREMFSNWLLHISPITSYQDCPRFGSVFPSQKELLRLGI